MWQVLGVDRDAAQAVDDGLLGLLWRGLGADGNRRSYHARLHAPQRYLQTLLHGSVEQVLPDHPYVGRLSRRTPSLMKSRELFLLCEKL